eukprot:gene19859-23796_t
MTIEGSDFGVDYLDAIIIFNNIEDPALSLGFTSSSLQVTIPANALNGDISVRIHGIQSNSLNYALQPVPLLNNIHRPPTTGGDLTITGSFFNDHDFADNPLPITVYFENVGFCSSPHVIVEHSTIVCQIPAGSGVVTGSITIGTTSSRDFNGSGADIYGTADAFFYASKPTSTSSASISVRKTSQTNTNAWAKAGVMFRESFASGSMYAFLFASPGNGINLQCRSTTNGSAAQIASSLDLGVLSSFRLIRSGNTFTGQISVAGLIWINVGSCTVPMSNTATAGLAITSHANTVLSTAVFDTITIVA